ncbi:MAG: substrate-binding domain-containing protein [Bacteroidota bacterium]
MRKTYTIKDIAKLANVSRGTVDRVLHKRGKVSEDALIRVNKVLEEINYEPNLIARGLKNSKGYYVAVLMPDYAEDPYWYTCYEGIEDAIAEFKSYRIFIDKFYFKTREPGSFMKAFEEIKKQELDGLVLVPAFPKEAEEVYAYCKGKNIASCSFNTPPSQDINIPFVGQDMLRSGRLGAELLYLLNQQAHRVLMLHINDEAFEHAIHLKRKEEGFRTYLADKPGIQIERLSIQESKEALQKAEIRQYLASKPDISGIWVSSSKVYLVAEILESMKLNCKLVGYDLIDENINHLQKGSIDLLINQNPRSQAFYSVASVAEHLAFSKDIPKQYLLPIDIVSRENLVFYQNTKRNRIKLMM